jgi:uncharacterized protein YkwD
VSLRNVRRAVTSLLAATLMSAGITGVVAVAAPSAAFADSTYSMEAQFIAKMNAARQANGQAPYSVSSDLTAIARSHSANMASKNSLYHNPSLTSEVQNWQAVGENVGEGGTVSDIHTAFMNSPEHRANILDHDFTQVGVGVSVDKRGVIWVTEDFREPMYSSSSSSSGSGSHHHKHHSSSTSGSTSGSSGSTGSTTPSSPTTTPTSTPSSHYTPQPTMTPRAQLRQRLHQLRQHHSASAGTRDPVAQAFVYADALSRLTG